MPGVEAASTWGRTAAAAANAARISGCGDDVQILDGLGHSPGRARELGLLCSGVSADRLEQLLADHQRSLQRAPLSRSADLVGIDGLQQCLLGLGTEPLELADTASRRGLPETLERVDAELLVKPTRALGAESRKPRHLDQPRWELRAQLLECRDLAGLRQRHDLLLQSCADAGQLCGLALACELRDLCGGLAHRLGTVAVGDDPMDRGAVKLVQIAEFVERGCDLAVGRVRHDSRAPRA